MLDYKKLNDSNASEYINRTVSEIKSASETELLDNLRMLQIKLYNKEIDSINATMLMGAIKRGIKERRNMTRSDDRPPRFNNEDSGGRTMALNPVGGNGHTSVSNRAGAAAVIFIVVNVGITTVMYTLLLLSKLLK